VPALNRGGLLRRHDDLLVVLVVAEGEHAQPIQAQLHGSIKVGVVDEPDGKHLAALEVHKRLASRHGRLERFILASRLDQDLDGVGPPGIGLDALPAQIRLGLVQPLFQFRAFLLGSRAGAEVGLGNPQHLGEHVGVLDARAHLEHHLAPAVQQFRLQPQRQQLRAFVEDAAVVGLDLQFGVPADLDLLFLQLLDQHELDAWSGTGRRSGGASKGSHSYRFFLATLEDPGNLLAHVLQRRPQRFQGAGGGNRPQRQEQN
jgi:hypothetical protein